MGTLHEHQYTFMITSRLILLRMRNVSDESCRENQNTLLCSITFLRKSCRLWDNVGGIWWSQRGHGWRQYKKGHVHCMLGNYGHRRARIWRTYFLFVLPRTNLNHINIFFWNNHFPMPRFEPRTPRIQNIHNHCTKVFFVYYFSIDNLQPLLCSSVVLFTDQSSFDPPCEHQIKPVCECVTP